MKKTLLFALTLLFATQMALADGAIGVAYDTFGKCDEQYYSVIKLKIKRPEAVPFTINNRGGKVEFSTGNLQYQATTKTFRFARRQWETVGYDGTTDQRATLVPWDSMIVTPIDGTDPVEYDTTYETKISRNQGAGKKYGGWIDVFGWATSGFKRTKVDKKDPYNTCTAPYSTSILPSPAGEARTANYYGYGPSVNIDGVYRNIDTTDGISRNYDWGQYNDIYCIWVGYDTTKAEGNTGYDTILFDSTMFQAGLWRTLRDTEWAYLLNARKIENKKSKSWAICGIKKATASDFNLMGATGSDPRAWKTSVDTVKGLFIFPDEFELETAVKLGFVSTEKASIVYGGGTTANAISYKSFMALEKLGVIFMPLTGYVPATGDAAGKWNNAQNAYWSATATSNQSVNVLHTNGTIIMPKASYTKASRVSVRLVRDLDVSLEHPGSVFQ